MGTEEGQWESFRRNPNVRQSEAIYGHGRYTGCRGAVRIEYIRNDMLDVPSDTRGWKCAYPQGDYCLPWAEKLGDFDVVVVNSGAHFVDDSKYKTLMQEAARALNTYKKENALVIFRTTVPGHSGCNSFTTPFNSSHEADEVMNTHPF